MKFLKFFTLLLLLPFFSKAQTTVTVGGGATVTCPATPTATWTTPPTGLSFSNWSRGSGLTCASAAAGLSASNFATTSALGFSGNKFYSVTLTTDATHYDTLTSVTWATAISSGTVTFTVQYSNNGGALTTFGTAGLTGTTTNTFTGSVTIAPSTSLILYLIPTNTASGSTIRWNNGSTIVVKSQTLPTATISSTGTLTARSTTYGTASTVDSFSVSGTTMSAGILVTPPTAFEVSASASGPFTSTVTIGAAGTIAATPVYYRLKATTTPGTYSGNIVLTSTSATTVNVATVASTVSTKALTITGATANSKVYNGSAAATISGGSLVGIVGSDVVTFSGGGTFADANAGTAKPVTTTLSLGGAQASFYTLTQPTGLTANITQATQTITFPALADKIVGDPSFTLTATSSSGLPVSYSSATPTVASVSGSTVTIGIAGTAVITASQAGNINYSAATPVDKTQTVLGAALLPQTILFSPLAAATYGDAPYSLTATATSGLAVSYASSNPLVATVSGSTITIVGPGTSVITASQAGDGTYAAAPDSSLTLTVNVKNLTITGAVANDKPYDGTTVATISGGTLVGVISPDVVSFTGGGTFASPAISAGIPVTTSLTLTGANASKYSLTQPSGLTAEITKGTQVINFPLFTAHTTLDSSFALSATASSGLAVTYTSSNPSVAIISGSTVIVMGAGTAIITASQAGNSNYFAAPDSSNTLVIGTAPLVAWDLNGASGGGSPFAQTVRNPYVTIVGLTRASGITSASASNTWGSTNFNTATSAATAIANNDYVTFSITVAAGYSMSLTSIPAYNIRRSASGPSSGQWQYQVGSGSFVDIGTTITWGATTSASGNTQPAITLSGISALQNISGGTTITFRVVPFNASATGGTWYFNDPTASAGYDFQVNGTIFDGCTPATELRFTTQPTVGQNINQGGTFNIAVSATCADGNVASSINTGTVTIDFSGCGLTGATYPANTRTANIVNGVATFTGLSVSRSIQSGVTFTTTNTLSLTDATSNSFNIIAPVGSSSSTTLKDDNFSAPAIAWGYSVGTPVVIGSGGTSGSDVTGIQTVSGNSFLRKSYSALNASGEKGTTTTITFDNLTGLGVYNTTDFSFKVASSVGMSGSGAGNDNGEDMIVEISLDGGSSWSPIMTHQGASNNIFSFSSTSPYALSTTSNVTFSGSSTKSAYTLSIPTGTTQFRFRVTATNNRSNESWGIDDVKLIGNTVSGGVTTPLPTVNITGGEIVCGPPYTAVLHNTVTDAVGSLSYAWTPAGSLDDSTLASPSASPLAPTTYSLMATDGQGCVANTTTPASVNFTTPELVLTTGTATSSGYCDAADGYRYYQVAGSSPAEYFFAIKWDADNDNIIDAAAKNASTVTVTNLGTPFTSTTSSNEHGSILMKRYWNVDIAGNMMTEPVDVKFYYDDADKTELNAVRDANKAAASVACGLALENVNFAWFKTVGTPMNGSILSSIDGNDFSAFPSIGLSDANASSSTEGGVLFAQFNGVTSFSGGTGGIGFAPYSGVALPVALISFTAIAKNNIVNLNWTTATEINNDFFTVERSKDGVVFEAIATQKGAGNSTIKINYATIDNAPYNGVSYYRLKQTDLDGKESYSMIRSVNIENGNQVIITHYPNPVNESVKFVFSSTESAIAKYMIYDAIGNIAYEGSLKTIAGSNEFNLAVPALSQGIYILKMNINGTILTDKFMKQ